MAVDDFPSHEAAGIADVWALDPAVAMLNHGSFGACPRAILDRQNSFRQAMEAEPVRFLIREMPPLRDASRRTLADFLGADADDLVFVPNTTAGVNSVLRSLRYQQGDEILITDHGYNACNNAARYAVERGGATIVVAQIPLPVETPEQVIDAVLARVNGRTRLALLDHVTSPTGIVFPIQALVEQLEARGVDTLVDGAHAPGMIALDLNAIGAAYYTGNCHKWLCAPKGAAFLHVRRDRQEPIQPPIISHGFNRPGRDENRLHDAFDWPGTDDPTAWLCVGPAIEFMGGLVECGWPAILQRNHQAAIAVRRMLCKRLGVRPVCVESMLGSMAAVHLPDDPLPPDKFADGHRLNTELLERFGIEVPVFFWPSPPKVLLRISTQLYNQAVQYERLAEALASTLPGVDPGMIGPDFSPAESV